MLVYRLEHFSGSGPYRCEEVKDYLLGVEWEELDELSNKLCETHSTSANHPIPDYFFTLGRSCACESFDKLCEWFDGFLEKFAKFGYDIAVYDAADVKKGYSQVCFKQCYATLVERISIL